MHKENKSRIKKYLIPSSDHLLRVTQAIGIRIGANKYGIVVIGRSTTWPLLKPTHYPGAVSY